MSSPVVIFGGSHIALQSALALARRQMPVHLRPIPAECSELPAQLPEGIVLEPLPRMLSGSVPELPADCGCAIVASDNEAFNLQLTLLLEAHYPQLRIVTRLFNQTLGRDLEQRFARV